jgi:glyoxylase-like metal-dependent hydrolase (beta-lactamase superfamily II)
MVNAYILYEETGECILIDAACYETQEKATLIEFIEGNKLKPVRHLNTHCHIDHILGNGFVYDTFGLRPEYHEASLPFIAGAKEIAASFGYTLDEQMAPARFLLENEKITLGGTTLEVLYTPGHADGSVCFYSKDQDFIITGDVLFRDTIGRTDLPSGNLELLLKSIREKLFPLPGQTVVYPGHGPQTLIGYEKENNPFVR